VTIICSSTWYALVAAGSDVMLASMDIKGGLLVYLAYIITDSALTAGFLTDIRLIYQKEK